MASLQVAQRPPLLTSLSRKPMQWNSSPFGETLQKTKFRDDLVKKEKRIFLLCRFGDAENAAIS